MRKNDTARLENVVCIDGKPVWIDFADGVFLNEPRNKEYELKMLRDYVEQHFNYTAS